MLKISFDEIKIKKTEWDGYSVTVRHDEDLVKFTFPTTIPPEVALTIIGDCITDVGGKASKYQESLENDQNNS